MRKRVSRIIAKLLVFVMVLQMALPMTVLAAPVQSDGENSLVTGDDYFGQNNDTITEDGVALRADVGTDEGFTIKHVATDKLVKSYETDNVALTVDGEEGDFATIFSKAVFGINDNNSMGNSKLPVVSLVSKEYNKGIASVGWNNGAKATVVKVNGSTSGNGWESVQIVANGDGTVSFKDSYFDKYITVETVDGAPVLQCMSDKTRETLTENEKFIINSKVAPNKVESLAVDNSTKTQTTLDLTWNKPASIYTNVQVLKKGPDDLEFKKIADLADETSYQVTGLSEGTEYSFKLLVINGNGDAADITYSTESNEVTAKTRAGLKPATPTNLKLEEQEGGKFLISWDTAENATHYRILRAQSMFGTYQTIATVSETSAKIAYENDRYENYYRVVALNNGEAGGGDFTYAEESEASAYVSLETEMFGDHTLVFAPTDDVKKIDETLHKLFDETNDSSKDAQFRGEHWQVYFKPGDYTQTSCINLGFYTSINGLGETPYDVKLNNIAIPDYLGGNNATCNFWRSTENLSIINTGNEQGKAQYGSWRGDWFNWAVAQAAPLRRVYSERPVAYDWNYGWASGGYVADCYFTGIDGEGNSAGTWAGQQFYTRNTEMAGNAFGTTLNNFFQGVEAPNLPNADGVEKGKSRALLNGNGYSNWKIADSNGNQQVFTNVEETKKLAEKPFLYIDDNGKYQVFVPAVRENTKGISWSKDDMGEGKSVSLDTFYIAKPTDSAATINAQLAAGKNIYFTPGIYHAEETIKVTKADTIILGSGLATIIPDNEDAAMRIADVDGVRVAGIILDAGKHSEYLLVVGEQGSDKDHSANPTILQDIFLRVGGTTDELTKSDNALEINSNNVIGDHFWIWRADHGAGVAWNGNESQHGLIVNGDDVTCYALFNEHFQDYTTLWNGENGATYFYQNETCYDPISQEEWMSHDGTVNGYASYKVADGVDTHYAIGLGIYNVFIFTGPTYDASEVQIQLDNAIEVPDKEGVLIENACLQTFADETKVLQKINSVVNGMGDPVSSGTDPVTGEKGTSWDRSFLLYYNNGVAEGSYRKLTQAYKSLEEKCKNISEQLETITDEAKRAELEEALKNAKKLLEGYEISISWPIQEETKEKVSLMEETISEIEEIVERVPGVSKTELKTLIKQYSYLKKDDYTQKSWDAFLAALQAAKEVAGNVNATQEDVDAAVAVLQSAQKALVKVNAGGSTGGSNGSDGNNGNNEQNVQNVQIKISIGKTSILQNETTQCTVTGDKNPTYASNNNAVATVDANGVVTGISAGTATITATSARLGSTASVTITVVKPTVKWNATYNTIPLQLKNGEKVNKTTVLQPMGLQEGDSIKSYSSSKTSVATVKKATNGKLTITPKKTGSTKITVTTTYGATATFTLKVQKDIVKVNELIVDNVKNGKLTLNKGESFALQTTKMYITALDKVTFTSNNKEVITVSSEGMITAKKKGTAKITVNCQKKKVVITVIVK
ncbi:MAG: Ig-like domain-containing protein [Clostridiales bacterium]|nr:Ig-like domain-containing protein [Clostridiales bacterium]